MVPEAGVVLEFYLLQDNKNILTNVRRDWSVCTEVQEHTSAVQAKEHAQ